jgi:hypothetical protein
MIPDGKTPFGAYFIASIIYLVIGNLTHKEEDNQGYQEGHAETN